MKRFLLFSLLTVTIAIFGVVGCKKKGAEEAGVAEEVVEMSAGVEEGGDEVVLEKPLEVGEEGP